MSEWLVADGARDKFSTDLLWRERSTRDDSRNSSLTFKRDDMFWLESPDMEPIFFRRRRHHRRNWKQIKTIQLIGYIAISHTSRMCFLRKKNRYFMGRCREQKKNVFTKQKETKNPYEPVLDT